MVIRYLYIIGIAVPPHKAHSELFVDGDAVLTRPIMAEFLQPVPGRDTQISQRHCRVECSQFPFTYSSQIRRGHALALARIPELLGVPVGERFDHLNKFNATH